MESYPLPYSYLKPKLQRPPTRIRTPYHNRNPNPKTKGFKVEVDSFEKGSVIVVFRVTPDHPPEPRTTDPTDPSAPEPLTAILPPEADGGDAAIGPGARRVDDGPGGALLGEGSTRTLPGEVLRG